MNGTDQKQSWAHLRLTKRWFERQRSDQSSWLQLPKIRVTEDLKRANILSKVAENFQIFLIKVGFKGKLSDKSLPKAYIESFLFFFFNFFCGLIYVDNNNAQQKNSKKNRRRLYFYIIICLVPHHMHYVQEASPENPQYSNK